MARVEIERNSKKISINIFTARPGLVIGKGGSEVESLKKDISKMVGFEVQINVNEIIELYVPIYEARLVGPKKSVRLMRIDGIRKKIL